MARSISAFTASLSAALDRAQDPGMAIIRRRLRTIAEQCGWSRRSKQRIRALAAALAEEGIHYSIDITKVELGDETWVRFAKQPFERADTPFENEREVSVFLSQNKSLVEGAAGERGLVHLFGGSKPEKKYALDGRHWKPDLVFRTRTGGHVVVEVELGAPKYESVSQLASYLQAVASNTAMPVKGLLITTGPSTPTRAESIRRQIRALAHPAKWVVLSVHIDPG